MATPSLPERAVDPRRYFESVDDRRAARPERKPVCLYLETTNRCNLLCTTCPRTYEELEPPADMSFELFTSIVDQVPGIERAVLHGVGEPMLVKHLPKMVRYLKDRGTYVLFNTNGTVLNERNGRALIAAGLDELRVSLDAANEKSYLAVRGKNYFKRILKNIRAFRELQEREGSERPRVSVWLTGLKETIAELPEFVKVAASVGVKEVYLQRLVFFEQDAIGLARPDQALYDKMSRDEAAAIEEAAALAQAHGMTFSASGAASEPGMSLKRNDGDIALVACAAVRGPSCISPPTGARCPAASRPSRSAATRITRWATPPSRRCARSGTARPMGRFAPRCCPISRRPPARAAACAGAFETCWP